MSHSDQPPTRRQMLKATLGAGVFFLWPRQLQATGALATTTIFSVPAGFAYSLEAAASWLAARAREIVDGSRLTTVDGIAVWTPAANELYNKSTYPRDFFYTADAAPFCFTNVEIRDAISLMLSHQATDGAIPNSISAKNKPWFWLSDNSQFLVNLVYLYVERSGDLAFFKTHAEALEKALGALKINSENHLIRTDKSESMYGFNDAVPMKGDDLFCSLLLFQASTKLARLFQKTNDGSKSVLWQQYAENLREGLQSLYDPKGYFLAASEQNRQPSVWGSAFAVSIGATTKDQSKAIGMWLEQNYEGYVQRGQIRHLVSPLYWEKTIHEVQPGTYQNGGYWATPFEWVYDALQPVNAQLADRLLREVIDDFQEFGINEVVNHEIGWNNRAGHAGEYGSSLAPLIVLRKLGVRPLEGYTNVAASRNGGRASVSSVIRGGSKPEHQPIHLNDGKFGNRWSWIPDETDANPWLEIHFAKSAMIDLIIFGRDQWAAKATKHFVAPNQTGLDDRPLRTVKISAKSAGTKSATIIFEQASFPKLAAGQNCVIRLEKPVLCESIRLDFQPSSVCLDEVEVFGVLQG